MKNHNWPSKSCNFQYVFTPFLKLCGCRFLCFFSLLDIRNEALFLILEHSGIMGLNRKNMKFCPLNPYYKRSDLKTCLSERFSEAPLSKLWNKKYMWPKVTEMEWNWIMFTPLGGFIKNLRSIYRIAMWNSHDKIRPTILCEQNFMVWLVKKGKTVFNKLLQQVPFSVSAKQASRQANSWSLVFLSQIFRYFPAFQVAILVKYPVVFILGKCLMDS